MTANRKLTIVDHILLAAQELGAEGTTFTAEDLVVKAWARAPDSFGLQGYADKYPDSNRVLSKIMGSGSPLRKRGLLRKTGRKQYQLTEAGRQAARELVSGDAASSRRLAGIPRGLVTALGRMLRSRAFSKFTHNEHLTFSDVCGFWNISPRTSASQFIDRTSESDAAISEALAHADDKGGHVSLPGDVTVEVAQLRLLRDLAQLIREQFASEIAVIEARKDERRL